MFGEWNIKVSTGGMPEKVATAISEVGRELLGAEYTPIAYLGSQEVNGINHAVLAEQLVIAGHDTKNVVVMIFNEKGMDCTLVDIERVVESGAPLGGITVDVTTEIPTEAQDAFDKAFASFVGSGVKPFALLATQMTKGMNYVFAAEVTPVTAEPSTQVALVTVNAMTKQIAFADLLKSKHEVSLGKPLGEWG